MLVMNLILWDNTEWEISIVSHFVVSFKFCNNMFNVIHLCIDIKVDKTIVFI